MNSIRVRAAGQRFGCFTKLRMYPTQAFLIQEYAGSVSLMIQSKTIPMGNDQRSIINDTVSCLPFLLINSFLFFSSDDNLMFPAAATAIVTAPVLQNRKNDARPSHDEGDF